MDKVVRLPPKLANLLKTTIGSTLEVISSLQTAILAKCHVYSGVWKKHNSTQLNQLLTCSVKDQLSLFTTCRVEEKIWQKIWTGIWIFRACEHTCCQTSPVAAGFLDWDIKVPKRAEECDFQKKSNLFDVLHVTVKSKHRRIIIPNGYTQYFAKD